MMQKNYEPLFGVSGKFILKRNGEVEDIASYPQSLVPFFNLFNVKETIRFAIAYAFERKVKDINLHSSGVWYLGEAVLETGETVEFRVQTIVNTEAISQIVWKILERAISDFEFDDVNKYDLLQALYEVKAKYEEYAQKEKITSFVVIPQLARLKIASNALSLPKNSFPTVFYFHPTALIKPEITRSVDSFYASLHSFEIVLLFTGVNEITVLIQPLTKTGIEAEGRAYKVKVADSVEFIELGSSVYSSTRIHFLRQFPSLWQGFNRLTGSVKQFINEFRRNPELSKALEENARLREENKKLKAEINALKAGQIEKLEEEYKEKIRKLQIEKTRLAENVKHLREKIKPYKRAYVLLNAIARRLQAEINLDTVNEEDPASIERVGEQILRRIKYLKQKANSTSSLARAYERSKNTIPSLSRLIRESKPKIKSNKPKKEISISFVKQLLKELASKEGRSLQDKLAEMVVKDARLEASKIRLLNIHPNLALLFTSAQKLGIKDSTLIEFLKSIKDDNIAEKLGVNELEDIEEKIEKMNEVYYSL